MWRYSSGLAEAAPRYDEPLLGVVGVLFADLIHLCPPLVLSFTLLPAILATVLIYTTLR